MKVRCKQVRFSCGWVSCGLIKLEDADKLFW